MKKKIYLLIFIFFIFLTIYHLFFPVKVYQNTSNGGPRTAVEIKEDDVLEEYFTTDLIGINRIGIRFSTYQYKNTHGKISITLYGNDKVIKTQKINLKNIDDNQMIYLNFNKQNNSNKIKYKIQIKYEEYYEDIKLATWLGLVGTDNNYVLINGNKEKYSLYYTIKGKGKVNDFILYDLLVLSILIVVYSCCGGDYEKHNKK